MKNLWNNIYLFWNKFFENWWTLCTNDITYIILIRFILIWPSFPSHISKLKVNLRLAFAKLTSFINCVCLLIFILSSYSLYQDQYKKKKQVLGIKVPWIKHEKPINRFLMLKGKSGSEFCKTWLSIFDIS